METSNKIRVAGIKGVRINRDHLEEIIEWLEDECFKVEIATYGVDRTTYKFFDSIGELIKLRGIKPNTVGICASRDEEVIRIMISMQYCIVETNNRINGELEKEIVRLLESSIPRLFKLFPFRWFALLTFIFLTYSTVAFLAFDQGSIIYIVLPVIVFILAALYNNFVNGINLIYSHEKSSFWDRKKDDIIYFFLSSLILIPIVTAIWEYWIKPIIESLKK